MKLHLKLPFKILYTSKSFHLLSFFVKILPILYRSFNLHSVKLPYRLQLQKFYI